MKYLLILALCYGSLAKATERLATDEGTLIRYMNCQFINEAAAKSRVLRSSAFCQRAKVIRQLGYVKIIKDRGQWYLAKEKDRARIDN